MTTQEYQDKGSKGQPGLVNGKPCLDRLRAIRLYCGSNGSVVTGLDYVVTVTAISASIVMDNSVVSETVLYSNAVMQKVIDFLPNDGTMGS